MRKPPAQQDHGIRSIFVSAMNVEEAPPSLLDRLKTHCTPHLVGHAAAGGTLGASLALAAFVALTVSVSGTVSADPSPEIAALEASARSPKADRLPLSGGKLAVIASEPTVVARSLGGLPTTGGELSYAPNPRGNDAATAIEAIQSGRVAVAALGDAPLGIALPTPPATAEEEDDEEDDAAIVPLPRVRPERPIETTALPRPRPADRPIAPSEDVPGVAAAPAPTQAAAPPSAPIRSPGQILGFFSSPSEPVKPQQKSVDTPFGVPYVLQTGSVETACLKPELVDILRRIEGRFHQKVVITSGFRDRGRQGSLHRQCAAVDIEVPGVASETLAAFARSIPDIGGVGTYCHANMIHVDIGAPRDWKYGCGSFFAMRGAPGKWGKVPNGMLAQQARAGAKPTTISDGDTSED